ncbi:MULTISPECIES: histidine phosphatase family protein [unclassified Roseovarius]|uniref:SixA phosphatase family protein n=1 Tax=unclassified Roseovarius TaxID=2614913 RepID=UPI00273FF0B6|nr:MULTISPECIES: histidine phosphatase family protein [unclassified Roseovarius]
MTKRLILMRHAKSSWDSPFEEDHQRPLNARGQRSAKALGDWLRDHDYLPDQVLSSSSTRTRETCAGLNLEADKRFLDGLYHAGAGQMLEILKQANGDCVLMLGHNPGIAWFASELVDLPPDHARFNDYPTCATLVVDFPVSAWRDLRKGTGKAIDFVIPRELTGG